MPSTGKSYSFTLRFLNTKSPLTYSELETCREIGEFLVSVAGSLDSYYPRDLKHRTYPAPSLSLFIEKIKKHCPPLNYLYSLADCRLKKNILIEYNNKTFRRVFVYQIVIGILMERWASKPGLYRNQISRR